MSKVCTSWEQIEQGLDECVQKELRHDNDNITREGWQFIEEQAPEFAKELIREDFSDDEIAEGLTEGTLEEYFNEALSQSEYRLRVN